MRSTYAVRPFTFTHPDLPTNTPQIPSRIILHRQGNPGATAINSLMWGNNTGTYTIHSYADGVTCYEAVGPTHHAFHVKEYAHTPNKFRTYGVYGSRGDYGSIGIESVDILKDGKPALSQETRVTLVLRVANYIRQFPTISTSNIYEHADLDPVNRADDLGDTLNLPDFRLDVEDVLSGRTPYRTVGVTANGSRNTDLPPVPLVPAPPVSPTAPSPTSAIRLALGVIRTQLNDIERAL